MSTFIGVPEKGRNAGIALEKELPENFNTDYLLDILNGTGKLYAKEGLKRRYVQRAVDDLPVEFKNTGRSFRRPVFTEIELENKKIKSFESGPFDREFDRLYQGFDQLVEQYYSVEGLRGDFEELVEDIAASDGYQMVESYRYEGEDGDNEITWGAMNSNLEVEPNTVLIPEEFQTIGKAIAGRYWDSEFNYRFFDQFCCEEDLGTTDEEAILAETPDEVAGVYMWSSGSTSERFGIEKTGFFNSRLGLFQNQYKTSEENSIRG